MKDDPIYEGLDRQRHRFFVGEPVSDHPKIASIDAGPTDAEYAAQLKKQMRALLEPVCELCNDAQRRGLQVNYATGIDGFGRQVVTNVSVIKPL